MPVTNILAINPQHCDNNNENDATTSTANAKIESTSDMTQSMPNQKLFTIVYAKRSPNSTNLNKWRYVSITLHSTDAQVVDLWTRTLQNELNGKN